MARERKEIDKKICQMADMERWTLPASCEDRMERLLGSLPESSGKEEKIMRFPKKRALLLAAALVAALGATAAAAELFSWDEQAVESFQDPSEEEQNTMTMEGIAKEQNISVTDAGITVTAVQTLHDKNSLYILLELTSDENIIDGNSGFENEQDGVWEPVLKASSGKEDAFNNIGWSAPADAPCFELTDHGYYEISALKSLDAEWDSDSVTIKFTKYIYYTGEQGNEVPHTIEGNWTLTLPLGEDTELKSVVYEPEEKTRIKDMDVQVKRVELSPLSMRLVFDMDDVLAFEETYYADQEDTYAYELQFTGFLDQNGQPIISGAGGGMSGAYDFENREIIQEIEFKQYVDVKQVRTLLLGEDMVQVPLVEKN